MCGGNLKRCWDIAFWQLSKTLWYYGWTVSCIRIKLITISHKCSILPIAFSENQQNHFSFTSCQPVLDGNGELFHWNKLLLYELHKSVQMISKLYRHYSLRIMYLVYNRIQTLLNIPNISQTITISYGAGLTSRIHENMRYTQNMNCSLSKNKTKNKKQLEPTLIRQGSSSLGYK